MPTDDLDREKGEELLQKIDGFTDGEFIDVLNRSMEMTYGLTATEWLLNEAEYNGEVFELLDNL